MPRPQPTRASSPPVTPPHDLAAERAVLATVLMDPEAWESVEALVSEDFYLEAHRAIWRQLVDARARGEQLDAVTLAHRLRQDIGADSLALLMTDATVPALLAPLVQALLDLSGRRTMQQLAAELAYASANGAGPEVAQRARVALETITARRVRGEADAPLVAKVGDDWTVTWIRSRAWLRFGAFRDTSEGINAEILVQHLDHDLHWGRLSLAATSSREQLRRKLEEQAPIARWREILDQSCRLVTDAYRQGEPIVALEARPGLDIGYLVEPLLPADQITVLCGDGGVGKGWLALSLAAAVSSGQPLPRGFLRHAGGPVLYLDWESAQDEQEERLAALYGHTFAETGILYQRMTSALVHQAARLRAEVVRRSVALTIVDSLAPACGQEPESSDAAVQALGVLRSLRCTCLVIAHVSKAAADNRQLPGRPYGSVFVQNLARSVWEMRRDQDGDENMRVALYHRKVNRGRLLSPVGLRLDFDATTSRASITRLDLADSTDLQQGTSVAYRLRLALKASPRTCDQLAEDLSEDVRTVRRTLERLRKAGQVVSIPGDGPLGWALASDR